MNAMAKQELGIQAKRGQLSSETTQITVYPNISFLGDSEKPVNFVDFPGLQDTEGKDQNILDNAVEQTKAKCPRIDMFLLCFEQGKFDSSLQEMMRTYTKFLSDATRIWSNMTAVITKISYNSDYEDITEWEQDMEQWKNNLTNEFKKRHKDADPTVLAISQDRSKPKRKENVEGSEQHNLMIQQMQIVYDKALEKHNKGEYQDCSNLAYTMTPETSQQWVEGKTKYLKSLEEKLHAVFNKDEILAHITNLLDQCAAKGGVCGKTYYS